MAFEPDIPVDPRDYDETPADAYEWPADTIEFDIGGEG